MRHLRISALCVALSILSMLVCGSAPRQQEGKPDPPERMTVAISNLTGADKELGAFLAETLLTDLARSDQLQPLERAEILQAFTDLQLPAASPLTPAQARQLGQQVHATRIIVGSYMVQEGQIIINARLLDAQTGLIIPGGAMNVSGDRKDLLGVTHRLARQFHKRVTGSDLQLEEPTRVQTATDKSAPPSDMPPSLLPAPDELEPLRQSGLIPQTAKANEGLSERDLTGLVKTISKRVETHPEGLITLTDTAAPVTRLRALSALVKLLVSPEDLTTYRTNLPATMPPDADQIPAWGVPFVAAAIDQGWLVPDKAIRYRDQASWGFVAAVLSKMPIRESQAPSNASPDPAPTEDNEPYTGLILDARDFKVERTMSPRLLDEDGHIVYPDPKHIPTDDYVGEHGMASYAISAENAKRAGKHPLVVKVLSLAEGTHDDLVVSSETAARIRDANKRDKFLWKWNVVILVDSH
ncbi:MAG TPA: FlgO family outer membrane protein [Chthonomonadaceae bacterium]|nr:FlgO family outer membrane protein [Chthonomonadaceae bacterium]